MKAHTLRVLLIREGEWWVAQALEVNISAQIRYVHEMSDKLRKAYWTTVNAYGKAGLDWTQSMPETPQRYFRMYDQAYPLNVHIDGQLSKLLGACDDEPEIRMLDSSLEPDQPTGKAGWV